MELETVIMDKSDAREAFLSYRRAVRERHDEEDAQIMRGYRELARGRQLVRLSETVAAGGLTTIEHTRRVWQERRRVPVVDRYVVPRLAVVRADARECWTFGVDREGDVELRGKSELAINNRRDRISFRGLFGDDETREIAGRAGIHLDNWSAPKVRALVPLVPPPLRPKDSLRNYHVLFEAEWAVVSPPAPTDPALLRHIGGDLYAVVAIWDLTEVERAVLALRS